MDVDEEVDDVDDDDGYQMDDDDDSKDPAFRSGTRSEE